MARDAKAFRLATEFGIETKSQKLKEDVCLIFLMEIKEMRKLTKEDAAKR